MAVRDGMYSHWDMYFSGAMLGLPRGRGHGHLDVDHGEERIRWGEVLGLVDGRHGCRLPYWKRKLHSRPMIQDLANPLIGR